MIPSRQRLRFLGAAASLFGLVSCIDYQEDLVLQNNLSGRLSATISVNQMFAGATGKDEDGSDPFSADHFKKQAAAIKGVTVESVEEFTESGKRHLRYSLSFDSIENLSLPHGAGVNSENGTPEADFRNFFGSVKLETKEGNLIIERSVVLEELDGENGESAQGARAFGKAVLQGLLGGSQLTYQSHFPSKVVTANSSNIDQATNTVVWKFDLAQLATEPALMRAEIVPPARGLDIIIWVLVAIIAIITLAVVGAGLLFITSRPRQSSAPSTSR